MIRSRQEGTEMDICGILVSSEGVIPKLAPPSYTRSPILEHFPFFSSHTSFAFFAVFTFINSTFSVYGK